ncbi:MAG: hypothetical protein ACOCP4_00720 [Candidatus Woesearchaeota archaeon]
MDYENIEIEELLMCAIKLIAAEYNEKFNGIIDQVNIPTIKPVYFKYFHMHPYCFCEDDNCPYCSEPNFSYYPINLSVRWYKHLGRGMEIECDYDITVDMINNMLRYCLEAINKEYVLKKINDFKDKYR